MRKIFSFLFVLLALLTALSVTVFAEDAAYYYVNSETGDDGASGLAAASAVKTFTQACRYAEKSGADKAYIVFTNDYPFSATVNEIPHKVPFVLTTKDGTVDYAAGGAKITFGENLRYVLAGDTAFANIAIEYSGTLNCVAQYHHITFGDGVSTTRTNGNTSGLYVVGGWQSPDDTKATDLDSHITIRSGSFLNVIGGSRQRAAGANGLVLSGTHYIDIGGGVIDNLYGASVQHSWSQNAVLTMTGGRVKNFYVGGDLSRRLNGSATLTLTGGEIGALHVNNVVGNADVQLLGTKVGGISVSYYNAEIDELRIKAKSTKTLAYDAHYYTESFLSSVSGFDTVQSNTVIYVKAGANGDGRSESTPASLADALGMAAEKDAVITLIGRVPLGSITEPAHAGRITVTGKDAGATLEISGTYTLAGETAFAGITLGGNFDAKNGCLIVDKTATPLNVRVQGSAHLYTGTYDTVAEAGHVLIAGDAKVDSVVGGSNASIEIHGGSVGTVASAKDSAKHFALTVSGGNVDKVIFRNVTDTLSCTLMGGTVGTFEAVGQNVQGTLVLNETLYGVESLGAAAVLFGSTGEKVFFLADGAMGSGMSASSPSSSLADAYAMLSTSGGTIVVCGKYTVATAFNTGVNREKITITSVYDSIDYRQTNDAEMVFAKNFYCGGETVFCDITLRSGGNYISIYANTHPLVLGEGITSYADAVSGTYLSVMGGNQSALNGKSTDLTFYSGTWQRVRGGTAADGSKNADVQLTVYGGIFVDTFTLGSSLSHDGDIHAEIFGGEFQRGIVASTLTKDTHSLNSDVQLTIYGGTFYRQIKPANAKIGKYSGSYTLTIYGGNFAHVNDIIGADGLGTMTSILQVAENIDLDAKITGSYSFTNPIRSNGADPWLFYCDGYYYYTATTGGTVGLAKAANIGDLRYAEYKTIYDPEDGHMWSRNLWSPEIHYYTDEEIGKGNGGWYLFMACDNGENVNHRMYVAKCLDGDNLLGRWGNPITGEVNVPQIVTANEISGFADLWAAGMSEVRVGGKLYMLYITETGRGTADFHQTINIVEMTNPWTIVGESKVICRPEYDWEMGGYAYNAKTGGYSPKVVEGSTAVYADDGTVYIVYSGSGYWTTEYCLATLKYLGGDPLEITSWEKAEEPFLYKSAEINGCGHASYVTDTAGQRWVCYHAYIGKDTSSGRYAFVEPYTADKNGIVVADGSGRPAPIVTAYTVPLNPLPLSERISGFAERKNVATGTSVVRLTIGDLTGYVNDAPKGLDAAPVICNSRTMLPIRFVAESFGATVDWNGATSTVTVKTDTTMIEIVIGKAKAKVNGAEIALDSPAFIEKSRTYLPVRFIAENLGAAVAWDGVTSTATLTK